MSKLDDIVTSALSNANINNDAAKDFYKEQIKDWVLVLIDEYTENNVIADPKALKAEIVAL